MRAPSHCTIDGCEKKHFGKGMCSMHYERVRTHGSTEIVLRVAKGSDVDVRAMMRLRLSMNSKQVGECIEYTGTLERAGYGSIMVNGHRTKAHRMSYQAHKGDIPVGLMVRHKCDNPPCINPEHLELGTQTDNMGDMSDRGRSSYGVRNPNHVLNDEIVRDILRRVSEGETQSAMAREYGVSNMTIYTIVHNKAWKHVSRDLEEAA